MWDEKGQDEKVLCVPLQDPFWNHVEALEGVPPHLLKEIDHFFQVYKVLENKPTGSEGWFGRDEAERVIIESQQRYIAERDMSSKETES